jgi:hypothetical protein
MGLILFFVLDLEVSLAGRNYKVNQQTAVDYYSMLREVCSIIILNDLAREKLGGPEKVVEIDETLVAKRKYDKGKPLERSDVWVVGGVERDTRRTFACPVKRRNKSTLFKLISHFVANGKVPHLLLSSHIGRSLSFLNCIFF